jgi:hypothetical protein
MSLAKVNHHKQPGHPSRMPLAEANHHTHSNVSWMIQYLPQDSNRSFVMNSFQRIYIMLEEGGNHLPISLVGCPCPVKGLILVVPPNTSNDY